MKAGDQPRISFDNFILAVSTSLATGLLLLALQNRGTTQTESAIQSRQIAVRGLSRRNA